MKRRSDRLAIFDGMSQACSVDLTKRYSTSFSKSIGALGKDIQQAIFSIYGFVRLADEIVDSFQGFDQKQLFSRIKEQTYQALDEGISTNPILHAFQSVVHQYNIERAHIDQFLSSMERDLTEDEHDQESYESYITGSAEVVGLMCLKVFVRGDETAYNELKAPAIRLGAAFQKVNFLRDVQEDFEKLGRSYFPGVDLSCLDAEGKRQIEADIEADLNAAYEGIIRLPSDTRFGVFLAYRLYSKLLDEIRQVPSSEILNRRVRVPDGKKALLWVTSYTRHRLNWV
ncbi:phytoene/squalene synthase family protein [bacterium]|nr:phytoene/squalene synthase family protein [bacterium]